MCPLCPHWVLPLPRAREKVPSTPSPASRSPSLSASLQDQGETSRDLRVPARCAPGPNVLERGFASPPLLTTSRWHGEDGLRPAPRDKRRPGLALGPRPLLFPRAWKSRDKLGASVQARALGKGGASVSGLDAPPGTSGLGFMPPHLRQEMAGSRYPHPGFPRSRVCTRAHAGQVSVQRAGGAGVGQGCLLLRGLGGNPGDAPPGFATGKIETPAPARTDASTSPMHANARASTRTNTHANTHTHNTSASAGTILRLIQVPL